MPTVTSSADAVLVAGPLLQAVIDLTADVAALQADVDAISTLATTIKTTVVDNATGTDIASDIINIKQDTKKPNPLGTNIKPWNT